MRATVARTAMLISIEAAFVVATVAVIMQSVVWLTTYSGSSAVAAVADICAGAGLMAAGTALVLGRVRPAAGRVAILAGLAWLSADWAGWHGGIALARTVAIGVQFLFLPLAIHLVTLVRHDPAAPKVGWIVRAGYAVAALLGGAVLLFRDPRLDLYCWSNCAEDVLLIGAQPVIMSGLVVAIPVFEILAGGALVAVSVGWIAGGTTAQIRRSAPVAVTAALVGVGAATHGGALLVDPHEGPRFELHVLLFEARAWGVLALAAGLGWFVIRAYRTRSNIVRLAGRIGDTPRPGDLGPALAVAAADPRLEVLYWMPEVDSFVDASARTGRLPSPTDSRTATRVVDHGDLIGVVVHDPAVVGSSDVTRLLGPTAMLAMENERLRVELLLRLDDVRASRLRLVAAADAARAELERDLHDGAQQSLLGVAYRLRLAAALATSSTDAPAAAEIDLALREAEATLSDLRRIAHGIHPAILDSGGLGPALRSLAESAPVVVVTPDLPDDRFPGPIERTVYAIAACAVETAAREKADEISIRVQRGDDGLAIELTGIGEHTPVEIADRVNAAGGRMEGRPTSLGAWIPCE